MNNHDTDLETNDWFDGESPVAPPSDPPDSAQLRRELKHRANVRRQRFAAVCASAACIALVFAWPTDSSITDTSTTTAQPAERTTTETDSSIVSAASDASSETAPIRVLATVTRPIAVFDVDEEKQIARHVGWIESRETVAVDLHEFSPSHRETIQATMTTETPPSPLISL